MSVVLGELDVARVSQSPGQQVSHQCEQQLGRIPRDRQLSGGQPEVASVPVDDVHQARIT